MGRRWSDRRATASASVVTRARVAVANGVRTVKGFEAVQALARPLRWSVNRSPARNAAIAVAARVRTWALGRMTPDDVSTVLAALHDSGIACAVAGGWGVDALLGEETRAHLDVDIVLDDFDDAVALADAALARLGYRQVKRTYAPGDWMPHFLLFDDGGGHRIELVDIDWPLLAEAFGTDERTARVEAFTTGTIGGRPVRCLAAKVQLLFHTGFPPRPADEADAAALLRLLGTATPFGNDDDRAWTAARSVRLAAIQREAESTGAPLHHELDDSLPSWLRNDPG